MKTVAVDTGGTFTDMVVLDHETGEVEVLKTPSTPQDPAQAITGGMAELLARWGIFFGYWRGQFSRDEHRHRRLAWNDHAVQRLGFDLAEPEKNPRYRTSNRRGKSKRKAHRFLSFTIERDDVITHAFHDAGCGTRASDGLK